MLEIMTNDRRALATLLLLVQAGLALLAALGLLVFARSSNALGSLAGPEAFAVGGPVALLILALGIGRGWRWASFGIVAWEALTLLGTAFPVLLSGGTNLSLTLGLTGFVLPLAIVLLVLRPASASPGLQRGLLVGLLLVTGFVHIALVPEHLAQSPLLGVLFALDGAAFVFLAVAGLRGESNWWRLLTVSLLLGTIVAYLGVVISRGEAVDDLGLATKLVELAALGLVLWPSGRRFDWRWATATLGLLLAITLSGAVAWAASLRPGPSGHTLDGRTVLAAGPPTDAQRLAAARLVDDTRAGIERFSDVQAALADGYRPSTPVLAPTVHYMNPAYQHDGRVDPTRPQALVYANTRTGPMLLGAMFVLPRVNMAAPNVGGSLAEWHTHNNLCFALLPRPAIVGLESPFGTCPVGSINAPTPAMLHVWTVANPGGPFGELSPSYVARLTRG